MLRRVACCVFLLSITMVTASAHQIRKTKPYTRGYRKDLGQLSPEQLTETVKFFVENVQFLPSPGQPCANFKHWFVIHIFNTHPTFCFPDNGPHTLMELFQELHGVSPYEKVRASLRLCQNSLRVKIASIIMEGANKRLKQRKLEEDELAYLQLL